MNGFSCEMVGATFTQLNQSSTDFIVAAGISALSLSVSGAYQAKQVGSVPFHAIFLVWILEEELAQLEKMCNNLQEIYSLLTHIRTYLRVSISQLRQKIPISHIIYVHT